MNFVPRSEKAKMGLACNQSADGRLWAGKGYELPLDGQFGELLAARLARAIRKTRGDRCGRFWVNLGASTITMAVGASSENEYETVAF